MSASGDAQPSVSAVTSTVELGYRIRRCRARFVFDPHATVQHFASPGLTAWPGAADEHRRHDVIMGRDERHDPRSTVAAECSRRQWRGRIPARGAVGRPAAT